MRIWLCFCGLLIVLFSCVDRAAAAETPPLPVRRVVLFTSGVAFVEHTGEVEGNQELALKFHVDDVNDLLKSMVVRDEGGGQIETITYASQEPLATRLGELKIDPSRVRSLGDLLQLLRGERVQVELTPNAITGQIVAVDRRKVQLPPDQTIDQETLLLKTDAGLRNVPLANVVAVKLLDEALDRDLQQALSMVAAEKAGDKKEIALRFQGAGKRQVRVGYIQEFPVWKASYRLVMPEKKEPQLQGWAIVENTTDQDWNNVQVALVNGRPVSFTMDLYSPIFLARPSVTPQLFAGLKPTRHTQDLAQANEAMHDRRVAGGAGGFAGGGGFGGAGGGGGGAAGRPSVTSVVPVTDYDSLAGLSSMQVAAGAAEIGAAFRYELEQPVTLAHQKSVMLPLIDAPVKTEKVAVYNESAQAKHPFSAIQLTNSTKVQLMPGPLTLFEGGEYAGDAELPHLAVGDKRLITYALDLNIEVLAQDLVEFPEVVTRVEFDKGLATVTRRQMFEKRYTLKNTGTKERKVLVEHPRDDDEVRLVSPAKPDETSRDVYRFAVVARPGVTETLLVQQEIVRDVLTRLIEPASKEALVANDEFSTLYKLARTLPNPSPAMQAALAKWGELEAAIVATSDELTRIALQRNEIKEDQARIRLNLVNVPTNSELQRRYLKSLDDQETELATLRTKSIEQDKKRQERQAALLQFLAQLQAK